MLTDTMIKTNQIIIQMCKWQMTVLALSHDYHKELLKLIGKQRCLWTLLAFYFVNFIVIKYVAISQ